MTGTDGAGRPDNPGPLICRALHLSSKRQRQILPLIAGHMTTGQAAAYLGISANTINHHVQVMMAKASVHSRRELAKLAVSQHLLDMSASPPRWIGCGCPLA